MAEEQEALRPWARKGGDKKRKTGGVLREKEKLFLSSNIFDGGARKKFTRHLYSVVKLFILDEFSHRSAAGEDSD